MQERGISGYQLSKAVGVSQPTVNAWLRGKVRPSGERVPVFPDMDSLEALCMFLECTPNDLLQLERESIGATWRDVGEPRRGRPPKATAATGEGKA